MKLLHLILAVLFAVTGEMTHAQAIATEAGKVLAGSGNDYRAQADEVMRHIQQTFYLPNQGLYARSMTDRSTDFMWGNGVTFSALLGASREDPKTYLPIVSRFFDSLDRYWDRNAKVPGYEPSQTSGDGHDKYYDDNAWMVLDFLEAYEMTHEAKYLKRAKETLRFVLSGWDDTLGGGIWWHEQHKAHSKNTCANAPAAVACLKIAKYLPADEASQSVAMGEKIIKWTTEHLEGSDGLYGDAVVDTGQIHPNRLTYNTGLMIRAYFELYRRTNNVKYFDHAKRSADAADWFVNEKTGAYRDTPKYAHLQVEADLEMFDATGDVHLLRRAMSNADHEYARWKEQPAEETIAQSSVARTLWLMADVQRKAGR